MVCWLRYFKGFAFRIVFVNFQQQKNKADYSLWFFLTTQRVSESTKLIQNFRPRQTVRRRSWVANEDALLDEKPIYLSCPFVSHIEWRTQVWSDSSIQWHCLSKVHFLKSAAKLFHLASLTIMIIHQSLALKGPESWRSDAEKSKWTKFNGLIKSFYWIILIANLAGC